jgi:sulfite exporter TauE/SafE
MTGTELPELAMAATAGLLGGLGHCTGMCGPIVAAFSMQSGEGKGSPLAGAILYNAGRVTTYTLLGALVGGLGSFVAVVVPMEGAQYALMAATGALMAFLGLSIAGAFSRATGLIERHNTPVIRAARSLLASRTSLKYLPLGLVLGLLPCGLSYAMLIGAAGSGGLISGALRMLAFGLGTVPAMFLIGLLARGAGNIMRGRLYRAGGAVVALMGLVYVYRGIAFYANL